MWGGAIQECLRVVEKRETRYRGQWYWRLCEEMQRGLATRTSVESIHGSLLALGQLLQHTGAHVPKASSGFCRDKDAYRLLFAHPVNFQREVPVYDLQHAHCSMDKVMCWSQQSGALLLAEKKAASEMSGKLKYFRLSERS